MERSRDTLITIKCMGCDVPLYECTGPVGCSFIPRAKDLIRLNLKLPVPRSGQEIYGCPDCGDKDFYAQNGGIRSVDERAYGIVAILKYRQRLYEKARAQENQPQL